MYRTRLYLHQVNNFNKTFSIYKKKKKEETFSVLTSNKSSNAEGQT